MVRGCETLVIVTVGLIKCECAQMLVNGDTQQRQMVHQRAATTAGSSLQGLISKHNLNMCFNRFGSYSVIDFSTETPCLLMMEQLLIQQLFTHSRVH